MSMIHRSCALVGRRSALIFGIARWRTVRSIEYSRHGRASTARPSHSRLVAFSGTALGAAGVMTVRATSASQATRLEHHVPEHDDEDHEQHAVTREPPADQRSRPRRVRIAGVDDAIQLDPDARQEDRADDERHGEAGERDKDPELGEAVRLHDHQTDPSEQQNDHRRPENTRAGVLKDAPEGEHVRRVGTAARAERDDGEQDAAPDPEGCGCDVKEEQPLGYQLPPPPPRPPLSAPSMNATCAATPQSRILTIASDRQLAFSKGPYDAYW